MVTYTKVIFSDVDFPSGNNIKPGHRWPIFFTIAIVLIGVITGIVLWVENRVVIVVIFAFAISHNKLISIFSFWLSSSRFETRDRNRFYALLKTFTRAKIEQRILKLYIIVWFFWINGNWKKTWIKISNWVGACKTSFNCNTFCNWGRYIQQTWSLIERNVESFSAEVYHKSGDKQLKQLLIEMSRTYIK